MIVKDVGGHFLIVFISRARQSSFKGRMCAEGIKCALGLSMESSRKVAIISLPVLSHHRAYRSVHGGSLVYNL